MAKTKRKKQHKSEDKLPYWKLPIKWLTHTWRRNWFNKAWLILSALVLLMVCGMYGIAQWYAFSHKNQPTQLGVTFIPRYATYLNVDPKETLQAILDDLNPTHLRLVSYWNDIERTPGIYSFEMLDWQFAMAEQHGTKVNLAIGLRQPRWPECHMPKWHLNQPKDAWYPDLKKVMIETVNRYKDHPALESYQLENEFFLSVFGECPDFTRDRLVEEYEIVKKLDPNTPVTISRSNNALGFPLYEPTPDTFGVSVYKRVWDKTLTKRYVEYPFPAWFYGFLAGGGQIITGKDMIIHELQAEAWTPEGYNIRSAPTDELYKSMNPERLRDRFEYGQASGIKRIDLWGAEWWYAMKVNRSEPGLWDVAREEFAESKQR